MSKPNSKTVVYMDLIGFGEYAKQDLEGTLGLLSDFQETLLRKLQEGRSYPPESYNNPTLKRIAEEHGASAFSDVLPFSDSIFLTGQDTDLMMRQIASMLIDCFTLRAYAFQSAPNPQDPTLQNVKSIGLQSDGKISTEDISERWFPALFRGGCAYGEVESISVDAMKDRQQVSVPNLVGPALVRAVRLEASGTGPRLFCEREVVERLSTRTRALIRPYEDIYEFLWPAIRYQDDANPEVSVNDFTQLFDPVFSLWSAWADKPFANHYKALIRLIVRSTYAYLDGLDAPESAAFSMEKRFQDAGFVLRKVKGSMERLVEIKFPDISKST